MAEWAEIRASTRPGATNRRAEAIVLFTVFCSLVWWGQAELAALLAVGALFLYQLRSLAPAVERRFFGTLATFGRAAGHVIGAVLLAVVFLLAFVPTTIVLRVLRLDPISSGFSPSTMTRWVDRPGPGRRARPRRPYAEDRLIRAPRGGWRRLVLPAAAIGTVALVATGMIWERSRDSADEVADIAEGAPQYSPLESAAMADSPFAPQLAAEIGQVFQSAVYDPYLGYALPDFAGDHVTVRARERLGYQPAVDGNPVEVWLFGGSTAFGVDQRDEHTIASELSRLAEGAGVVAVVRNFGVMGYVNHQETLLFEELLSRGGRPDIAVFYDGFNDLIVNVAGALIGRSTPGEPSHAFAAQVGGLMAEARGVPLEPPLGFDRGEDVDTAPDTGTALDGAMAVYIRGVERARRVGDAYGVPVIHAWQPSLYTKTLVPEEAEMLDPLGLDSFQFDGWVELSADARDRLPAEVIDLSGALDTVSEPVLTDFVHTNERGARIIAAELFEHLQPVMESQADQP